MIKDLGQVAAIYIGTTEPVNYTLLWLDTNKNPGVYKAYDSNLKQWVPLATQSWVQNLIDTWIQNWPVSDDLTEGDYILINKGGENYKIEAQDVIQNLIGKPLNFQNIVSNGSQLPASASDLKNGDLYILNVPGDIDIQVVAQPTQQVFPNRSILFWDEGEWKSMGRVEWKCDLSMAQTSDTVTVNSSLGTGITIPTATATQAGVLSAILFTYLTKLSNGTIIPRTPNGSTQTPGHIHNYTDIEGRIIVIDAVGDINKDLDTSNPPSQRAVTAALNTKYDKTGGEISGIVRITDGTEATQLGEGSLITNGGLSVFKNVFFGENLDVVGATYLHSTLDVDGITHILNTTDSTANNNGALVVDGGVGIAKNVNIGGAVDIDGNSSLHGTLTVDGATTLNSTLHTIGAVTFDSTLDVAGISNFNNTTDSTAYTNGAVVVDGGVGIAKRLNVHGAVDFDSTLNTDGAVTFNNTLDVDGATTLNNTLDVDGASVFHNTVKVEGITSITNTTASTDYNNGALVVTGGVGIQGALNTHGAVDFDSTLNVDGVTTISNTTDSTSTSTGALVVKGGTGIAKQLRVGGATNLGSTLNVTGATTLNNTLHGVGAVTFDSTLTVAGVTNVTNTTDATSTTTGAIHTAGGVGIAKQLRVGGNTTLGSNLSVGGNSTLAGSLTVNGATEVQDITIHGNVTQEGQSFITEAETVEVKDNILLLNRGETAAGVSKGISGIEVDRGTSPNFQFVFDESDDYFKAGEIGDLQILLLRDADANLTNNKFFYWDNANKIAKTREMLISDINDLNSTWDVFMKNGLYTRDILINSFNWTVLSTIDADTTRIYAPITMSTDSNQVLTGSSDNIPKWGYPNVVSVHDIRSLDTPNPTPDQVAEKVARFYFSNQSLPSITGMGQWVSKLIVSGWNQGYNVWELAGGSSTTLCEHLAFRAGIGDTWGDWHEIAFQDWTTTQLGKYLPLSGGTLTGALHFAGTALPATTTTDFFLCMDAFNAGGQVKYINASNVLAAIGGVSSSSLNNYLPLSGGTLTGKLTTRGINLNSSGVPNYGISFYEPSSYTWFEYMSQNKACTGADASTYGDVTSWARRSTIGDISGYGWIWDSCEDAENAVPDPKMALSSNTGNLEVKGKITAHAGLGPISSRITTINGIASRETIRPYTFTTGTVNAPGTDSISGFTIDDGWALNFGWAGDYELRLALDLDATGIAYCAVTPSTNANKTGWKFLATTEWINNNFFRQSRGMIASADLDTFASRVSGTYSVDLGGSSAILTVFARQMGSTSALEFYSNYTMSDFRVRTTIDNNKYNPWKYFVLSDSSTENIANYVKLSGDSFKPNNMCWGGTKTDGTTACLVFINTEDIALFGNTLLPLRLRSSSNPTVLVGSNTYTLLHTGNLGTITFTGAVSATYNGQSNITVNIPEGGGGGGLADIDISNGAAVSGQYVSGASASNGTITFTRASLPTLSGGASATSGQYVSGVTVSGHTVTVTKANLPTVTLNSLGITATATELNYCDGVTSNIQTQLNNKAASTHTHTVSQISNLGTNWSARLTARINVKSVDINGVTTSYLNTTNATAVTIYAPTSAGTDGYLLVSNGSGAPSWASVSSVVGTGFVTIDTAQTITGAKTFTAYTIFSNGAGTATSSDKRLKENIKEITYNKGFDEISLYSYNFKGRKEEKIGLIAQEVQKVIPQAVVKDEKGYLAIDTYPIVATLVAANKERVKEVRDLKSEIDNLKQEIETLKQEISILKRIVRL